MEVFLLILKIIGIVLLSVIALALLMMLLVLLWPFSYRLKVHKDEKDFNAAIRILWLLGLLTATVIYDGEAQLVIRVLGIPFFKYKIWPAETKASDGTEDVGSNAETEASEQNVSASGENQSAESGPDGFDDSYVSEGEFFDEPYEDSELLSDEEIDREIEERLSDTSEEDAFDKLPLGKKIKAFIQKIKELILKLREKCYNIKGSIEDFIANIKKKYKEIKYYYKLIRHPSVIPALQRLWKIARKMLKHIKPRRLKATVEYGSGDPASTMKVYGYYCMIYPYYGKKIKFTPDMENKVFYLDAKISGRVQMFRMMWIGWTLFADRNVRKLIRLIRREVKRRGRK